MATHSDVRAAAPLEARATGPRLCSFICRYNSVTCKRSDGATSDPLGGDNVFISSARISRRHAESLASVVVGGHVGRRRGDRRRAEAERHPFGHRRALQATGPGGHPGRPHSRPAAHPAHEPVFLSGPDELSRHATVRAAQVPRRARVGRRGGHARACRPPHRRHGRGGQLHPQDVDLVRPGALHRQAERRLRASHRQLGGAERRPPRGPGHRHGRHLQGHGPGLPGPGLLCLHVPGRHELGGGVRVRLDQAVRAQRGERQHPGRGEPTGRPNAAALRQLDRALRPGAGAGAQSDPGSALRPLPAAGLQQQRGHRRRLLDALVAVRRRQFPPHARSRGRDAQQHAPCPARGGHSAPARHHSLGGGAGVGCAESRRRGQLQRRIHPGAAERQPEPGYAPPAATGRPAAAAGQHAAARRRKRHPRLRSRIGGQRAAQPGSLPDHGRAGAPHQAQDPGRARQDRCGATAEGKRGQAGRPRGHGRARQFLVGPPLVSNQCLCY